MQETVVFGLTPQRDGSALRTVNACSREACVGRTRRPNLRLPFCERDTSFDATMRATSRASEGGRFRHQDMKIRTFCVRIFLNTLHPSSRFACRIQSLRAISLRRSP